MRNSHPELPNDKGFYLLVCLVIIVTGTLVYLTTSWVAAIPGMVLIGLFRGNWPKIPMN